MVRGIRWAAAVAFVLAATAGCTGSATHPTARGATQSPPRSPTPSPPVRNPTTAAVATAHVAIGPLQLTLPTGWHASNGDAFTSNICVAPAGKHPAAVAGCGGLDIWYGWDGYLPGN